MGKNEDDLQKSREERERIKKLFGGIIPESILKHDKSVVAIDLMADERSYTSTFHQHEADPSKLQSQAEALQGAFALSGAGARWGALSRFPQNVGRVLVELYSKKGQIVVDPFAGHNSRMELCWRLGRHYIGFDASKKFAEANEKIKEMLLHEKTCDLFPDEFNTTISVARGDSRHMPLKNSCGDFTITSPPYWCLEDYGDEMEQIGKCDEYSEFMRQLQQIMSENFRVLRAGAFAVWCVNDFTWEGKFYNYHGHCIDRMREVGFKQHDCVITDFGSSMGQMFASDIVNNKRLPKRHEYNLIFVKP